MPDARAAILDAAEELFARQGFAATTIKDIARAADVNSALLYYYFADKDALYEAVLERLVGPALEGLKALSDVRTPEEGIRMLIRAVSGRLAERPHMARFLSREMADHEGSRARAFIERVATGPFAKLTQLLRAAQATGAVRADIRPEFAAISIMAQVNWFAIARPAMERLLGERLTPEVWAQFADHAATFALSALRPV
ncbi:MAG TPA: CerR family C-terminal domain-containing protein [Gemmatimonadaceae bacterium]|nr:CerR family C-terminal domain-containing protein [Gemmatimonadaceae bacterium]